MGKQLLFDALQGRTTARPPWLAFVGCHGGCLLGKPADAYLRSGELIAQGNREAIRQYRPDGISVMFDLQIEAEALGCKLQWSPDHAPTVVEHVLEHSKLEALWLPDETSGRIPAMLQAIRQLHAGQHDVALYGLITGPFTLALHLKGSNLLMDLYDRPAEVAELLTFCTQVAKNMARMYIDAGCDVIASVDPITSQISPRAFEKFVAPYATELFEHIRRRQAFSSFFVCGHAQRNVEVMCRCKPDNVSFDENIPLDFVKEVSRRYGISFGGNLQLTVMLLMGSINDVRQHTLETMELGGDTGYILAPGCELPWGVPPANLQAVAEVVHGWERLPKLPATGHVVNVAPNFRADHSPTKVVVDVIVLDSEANAASQYMLEAVQNVGDDFGDLILWREHKIKAQETADFMLEVLVKNVPIICLDGEIAFVNKIPAREVLRQAIRLRLNERIVNK